MKNIFIILLFGLCNCQSSRTTLVAGPIFNFTKWKSDLIDSYVKKTDINVKNEAQGDPQLFITYHYLQELSETDINNLILKSKKLSQNWDKMFIIHQYIQEENITVSTVLYYKGNKYVGLTYDYFTKQYYETKYLPGFKAWKIAVDYEFYGGNFLIISEFNQKLDNIHNNLMIGISNGFIIKEILHIYTIRDK